MRQLENRSVLEVRFPGVDLEAFVGADRRSGARLAGHDGGGAVLVEQLGGEGTFPGEALLQGVHRRAELVLRLTVTGRHRGDAILLHDEVAIPGDGAGDHRLDPVERVRVLRRRPFNRGTEGLGDRDDLA
ncbi:hypothetical protein ACWEVP_37780 [Amycolatopsis sp. NPDC003865]